MFSTASLSETKVKLLFFRYEKLLAWNANDLKIHVFLVCETAGYLVEKVPYFLCLFPNLEPTANIMLRLNLSFVSSNQAVVR